MNCLTEILVIIIYLNCVFHRKYQVIPVGGFCDLFQKCRSVAILPPQWKFWKVLCLRRPSNKDLPHTKKALRQYESIDTVNCSKMTDVMDSDKSKKQT